MMKKLLLSVLLASTSLAVVASEKTDDPLLAKVMIGQMETRITDGENPFVIEAQGWVGKDLNKLWIKADIEKVGNDTEEVELQFLYSKAVAPYWDFQVGWRHDNLPTPRRDWLAIGFQGIAPYFFEIDTALFIGENGITNLRLEAEYEAMFTQRLVLSPEVSFDFYGKDDEKIGIGAGLGDMELGLRLRYEVTREFAPYVGVNWTKKFGQTADFAKAEGEDVDDVQLVFGVRAWF